MYVITGATGNTGSEIAHALLAAGKQVTVIGRNDDKLKPFTEKGAKAAIGDLEDTAFLTKTFEGATAVYALIPPKWDVTNWRAYQNSVAKAITQAVQNAQVKNVVVLSSNGAHLENGAGPVSGLHDFEEMLKTVPELNILSLRAGFFMQNFYAQIDLIKGMGMMGYSLKNDVKFPIVHTRDIAVVATKHLLALDFTGFKPVFVSGTADLSMDEVAQILGKAISKPDLKYVTFSYEDAKNGMLQSGLTEAIADGYNELFKAINEGVYLNDYQRTPESTTTTSLEWFASNEFAYAFQQPATTV